MPGRAGALARAPAGADASLAALLGAPRGACIGPRQLGGSLAGHLLRGPARCSLAIDLAEVAHGGTGVGHPTSAMAVGNARLFQASFSNAFDPMKSKDIFIV